MRILLDYRPALRQRTGVGEYVHEIASALVRRLSDSGDTLTLFSSSWRDRVEGHPVPGARVVDARIPVTALNFAWHRVGWPPIERLAGPVDIAHSLHPLLMPARRARQIVTIHDLDFLDHPERTRAEVRRDYAALAPSHAVRADAIVTVSAFTAGEITRRLGVADDRIVLCPPGAPPWRPRAATPVRGPILFMGTLEPRKNVATLLAAYAKLRQQDAAAPPLWLAGGLTEAAAPWIRAIDGPPFKGHVIHLGYIEADARYELYAQASMLVLPSYLEGFGMPVLEAMAVGVPVIVSNRGALPEVAADAAQVVDAEDADGFATAMRRYLEDARATRLAIERGFDRVRQYSWDASAAALLERYRQLA